MKYYTDTIKNPSDSYTCTIKGFPLPKGATPITKQFGGSEEEITIGEYADGIITIKTPIWVKNPDVILIGYKK